VLGHAGESRQVGEEQGDLAPMAAKLELVGIRDDRVDDGRRHVGGEGAAKLQAPRLLAQEGARALAARPRVTLVCGRYEGLDERVSSLVDDQICLGDFVLAGGELAAAVVLEATARLVPGVLGCGLSAGDESFSAGRLEYPQWTRPADWKGQGVPPVLLSGDHGAIERWRRAASLRLTRALRPDLLEAHPLTDEEQALLASAEDDSPSRT